MTPTLEIERRRRGGPQPVVPADHAVLQRGMAGAGAGMLDRLPLPLGQSLILIWPHITGLIAAAILLFALGYVLFQRQEIRA